MTRYPRPRRRKTTPRWGITEGDAEQISQGQREAKDTGEKTNEVHRTRKPKDEVLNAEKSKDAEVKQHQDYRPPEDYDAHYRMWRAHRAYYRLEKSGTRVRKGNITGVQLDTGIQSRRKTRIPTKGKKTGHAWEIRGEAYKNTQ